MCRVLCDMVNTDYPDVLAAIKKLQVLKDNSKLDWSDALRDVADLKKKVEDIKAISNTKPCCDEDLYEFVHFQGNV